MYDVMDATAITEMQEDDGAILDTLDATRMEEKVGGKVGGE